MTRMGDRAMASLSGKREALGVILAVGLGWTCAMAQEKFGVVDLPSSKQLSPVPGNPRRLNSLPISMAVSPDKRYVVTVNAGYGTVESKYLQSLAVMDTRTGKVMDFPDDRTNASGEQTLYSGLAFSGDGKHLYASMASLTAPEGDGKKTPGNGVAVYGFSEGKITQERVIPIGLQPLAGGRRTKLIGGKDGALGVPYPAAIAVLRSGCTKAHPCEDSPVPMILVADNLSDDVLLLDSRSGMILKRFDLSESDTVPGTYPVALAESKDGRRAFVALWNASEIVELDIVNGTVGRKLALLKPFDPVKPGTHPCALEISPDGKTLYVALANRDAVAAVDIGGGTPTHGDGTAVNGAQSLGQFAVKGYFDTRLPGQSYFGAEPDTLALNADGSRLYVGNMGSDAVAVIDTRRLTAGTAKQGMVEPIGFVPTEWMPMSMAAVNGKLYVATAKGKGTGPNNFAQKIVEGSKRKGESTYIGTLLYGSLAAIDAAEMERELPKWTAEVMESNRMKAAAETIAFAGGANPIKHVIYIIKENRTYDQIFGDLKQNGKPVGNGDPRLAMYGESITPNQHKLALQFGVLDNFFDSGEVSGDGHVWSNAAIGTDYLEKVWEQNYRNGQRTYDFEGVVSEGYPLLQKIADVNEPQSGYMWGNVDAHGKTHYNFGEYVSSTFCDAKKSGSSQEGPLREGAACSPSVVNPGERFPVAWGGEENKFGWPVPLLQSNQATKPELVGHFAPEAPDFNTRVPDQIRANVFLKYFAGWVADRAAGKDTMPNYITLHIGDDHTAGTTPGAPTPKASVADNDLAMGRMVEAVSHSPYWDDTAFFILEDDAQNGADHVDAHRSLALVVSKYSPRATGGAAYVDSRFYSTVSVIRTMETLLGLPPMNNNDALASLIGSMFTGPGDQAPFAADTVNRDNGLIYIANAKTAVGAAASAKMDFSHADRADAQKLNVILWRDAMGDAPMPAQLTEKRKKAKKDDDD
jgi:DNA-binding beta-propeller fold protein YncE